MIETLAHFRIVKTIGAGGMGEVYLAEDTRLRRRVALKVLPPDLAQHRDRLSRFEQEACAASGLSHPNILVVYEIGEDAGRHYIATEYVDGHTLRRRMAGGGLSAIEALDAAIQVAAALVAAHEAGIIHRDIKPANIFVTERGEAKLLDFGVAKIIADAGMPGSDPALRATEEHLTLPGSIVGTVTYMSPEQTRSEVLDGRSDLFSLGVVLYEMATGRLPFDGKSYAEVFKAILSDAPTLPASLNPAIPPRLGEIILKALEKDKALRYQHASDLEADLKRLLRDTTSAPAAVQQAAPAADAGSRSRRVAALVLVLLGLAAVWLARRDGGAPAAPAAEKRIAVLPFENLSGDPGQDYFADGMTEALTASLAQIRSLSVIARSSAAQYKGARKPIREIARELRVAAVVEGSFTRSGDRVRITAQLIQGDTESHSWARTFERELGDVLALQGEIAGAISEQVEAELSQEERGRLAAPRPVAARAYDAYLRGRFFLEQGGEDGLRQAFEQFNRALEIQPDYAAPHAGIASYYSILPFYSSQSPAEVYPKARAAAEKSVELGPDLPEAHAALAYVRAYYEWDWAGAERAFRRALDLSPSFADAHFSYCRFLAASGRMREAFAEIRRAEQLDPRSAMLTANTALLHYFDGRYDDALRELLEISRANPKFPVARWGLGLTYEAKGMGPEALAALTETTQLSKSLNHQSSLAHAQARFGHSAQAREVLARLSERSRTSYVPSYYFAVIHTGLGERDRAFEWLERAFQERSTVLSYLQLDPRLAPLRSDPRYADLVRRLGFPSRS